MALVCPLLHAANGCKHQTIYSSLLSCRNFSVKHGISKCNKLCTRNFSIRPVTVCHLFILLCEAGISNFHVPMHVFVTPSTVATCGTLEPRWNVFMSHAFVFYVTALIGQTWQSKKFWSATLTDAVYETTLLRSALCLVSCTLWSCIYQSSKFGDTHWYIWWAG